MTQTNLPLHHRNTRSSGCSAHRSPVHSHNLKFGARRVAQQLVLGCVALGIFLSFKKMYVHIHTYIIIYIYINIYVNKSCSCNDILSRIVFCKFPGGKTKKCQKLLKPVGVLMFSTINSEVKNPCPNVVANVAALSAVDVPNFFDECILKTSRAWRWRYLLRLNALFWASFSLDESRVWVIFSLKSNLLHRQAIPFQQPLFLICWVKAQGLSCCKVLGPTATGGWTKCFRSAPWI